MGTTIRLNTKQYNELVDALKDTIENTKDKSVITKQLSDLMTNYVHVATGYLRNTIYHDKNVAGAKAPYAGYEEERGDSHAYATQAINAFDIREYAAQIVKDF